MALVLTWIIELGVKVQHIPGGCTSLCQPGELRVAKPLKDKLRYQWDSWMIKEEIIPDGELPRRERINRVTTPPPKSEQIATWTIAALQSISSHIVRNAWHDRDFGWFPEDPAESLVWFSNSNDKSMLALPCMPFMAMIKALA